MNSVDGLRLGRGYWYLASPCSRWEGGLDDAAFAVAKIRGRLVLAGVANFSPVVHSHYVARAANIDPYSHAIWLPDDKPIFELSHGILVAALAGWRESHGVTEEIKWAREHEKPRVLLHPKDLTREAMP